MEYISTSTEETKKIAVELAKSLKNGDVILLYGDLGAGKTTFTRFLVEALGIDVRVQSPTFVLVRKYIGSELIVYHVDLYRLTSVQELQDLGLTDLLNANNVIMLIEWPELVEDMFKDSIKIRFEYLDDEKRKIIVE